MHVFCSLSILYIVEREHNFLNTHFLKQYKVMHLSMPLYTDQI